MPISRNMFTLLLSSASTSTEAMLTLSSSDPAGQPPGNLEKFKSLVGNQIS